MPTPRHPSLLSDFDVFFHYSLVVVLVLETRMGPETPGRTKRNPNGPRDSWENKAGSPYGW